MTLTADSPFRLTTAYVSTAANTTEQKFILTTQDDYRDRKIETVFCGIAVAGVQLGLFGQGQWFTYIDTTRFGLGDPVLNVDYLVEARLQIMVSVTDLSGTARNNIPIVFGYRVDRKDGP